MEVFMPNWCLNRLKITGPVEDVALFSRVARGGSPWSAPEPEAAPAALSFHSLVPIPPAVLEAGYHLAGYDWEREHWGCQWGACHACLVDSWDGGILYQFDTAWTPPLPFLQQVSRDWLKLHFRLEYEESLDGFQALVRAHGGQLENLGLDD
jgi:hypothetical protein